MLWLSAVKINITVKNYSLNIKNTDNPSSALLNATWMKESDKHVNFTLETETIWKAPERTLQNEKGIGGS